MADLAVTDLTFTVINEDSVTESGPGPDPASPGSARARSQGGGTKQFKTYHCTILIPSSALTYPTGGVPVSGVTETITSQGGVSLDGHVLAGNALSNGDLGCPAHIEDIEVLSNGNAAGLDDAFVVLFDRGVSGTRPHKLRILCNTAGGANGRLGEHSNAGLAEALTVYCIVTGR